jgi:hypothetical protein
MIYYSFTKTALSTTSFFNVLDKSLILLEIILMVLEIILILLEMILIILEMILILLEIILILLPKSLTEADNLPQKRPRFSPGATDFYTFFLSKTAKTCLHLPLAELRKAEYPGILILTLISLPNYDLLFFYQNSIKYNKFLQCFGQKLDSFGNNFDGFGNNLDSFGNDLDYFGNDLDSFGNNLDSFAKKFDRG